MDRHRRFARAEDKIARLSKQGLDMVAYWRASSPVLADAVPQAVAPCCYTIDPASRLLTSHFNEEMLELPPEWLLQEYVEDDVLQLTGRRALPERGLDVVRGHRRRSKLKPSLACPDGRRR
jgi:hypothetical protein